MKIMVAMGRHRHACRFLRGRHVRRERRVDLDDINVVVAGDDELDVAADR